jgi:hypothetical protein
VLIQQHDEPRFWIKGYLLSVVALSVSTFADCAALETAAKLRSSHWLLLLLL